MNAKTRLGAIAAALAGSLLTAPTVFAAYTPKFVVNHTPYSVASATTTITLDVPRGDDATAKVTFYAPLGYRGVLGQAAGTQVGTVAASVLATRISADAVLPLTGTIVTDDPARYMANPCAPGAHRAVWVLRLEAAGQTLQVPVYIDVATGGEANFATFKFHACLPSPHVPPEQGGATFGAQLLTARLQLNRGVLAAPTTSGRYVWPAFFTPYSAGSGAPNAAATVQSRAIVQRRGQATLNARYLRRTNTFRLSGSVLEFRIGIGGATVEIWKGLRTNRIGRVSRTGTTPNGLGDRRSPSAKAEDVLPRPRRRPESPGQRARLRDRRARPSAHSGRLRLGDLRGLHDAEPDPLDPRLTARTRPGRAAAARPPGRASRVGPVPVEVGCRTSLPRARGPARLTLQA